MWVSPGAAGRAAAQFVPGRVFLTLTPAVQVCLEESLLPVLLSL